MGGTEKGDGARHIVASPCNQGFRSTEGTVNDPRLWLTGGAIDLTQVIAQFAAAVGSPADVDVIVTAAGHSHVAQLAAMRASGILGRVRLVCDIGTIMLRTSEAGRDDANIIDAAIGAEWCRAIRIHAKAFRISGPRGTRAIITSANLNRNNRPEQYERADHVAPAIERLVDLVFDHTTPGLSGASHRSGFHGMNEALGRFVDDECIIYREPEPIASTVVGRSVDHVIVVERIGVAGMIPAALELAGRGATVSASTWGLTPADVRMLKAALDDGRMKSLSLGLPSRMGRRDAARKAYCTAVALINASLWWSPTHAKIAVIDGPDDCIVITGGANFMSGGQLDMTRIRRGDIGLARHATAVLDSTPREPAPPHPSAEEIAAVIAASQPSAQASDPLGEILRVCREYDHPAW